MPAFYKGKPIAIPTICSASNDPPPIELPEDAVVRYRILGDVKLFGSATSSSDDWVQGIWTRAFATIQSPAIFGFYCPSPYIIGGVSFKETSAKTGYVMIVSDTGRTYKFDFSFDSVSNPKFEFPFINTSIFYFQADEFQTTGLRKEFNTLTILAP